jgi:hypothetical protein
MKFVWCRNDLVLDLEKVRNFTIINDQHQIIVLAWFNDKESLHINRFDDMQDATKYLNDLIGGKK